MAFGRDTLNLEKQFVFYASYHNHWVNVAIHLLCIWPILATLVLMLQYTPVVGPTPEAIASLPFGGFVKLNAALLLVFIYVVCYPLMDPVAGTLGSALVSVIYVLTSKAVSDGVMVNGLPVWQVALGIHVAAWILQFIGHGVFEGRAPALLDSADQAFLTAPLFVLLEVLFFFGYRKDFYAKMMKQVEKNIAAFKRGGGPKQQQANGRKKR